MASVPRLTISVDFGITHTVLKVLGAALAAPTRWEAEIEISALKALSEIQDMTNAARLACGLKDESIGVRFHFEITKA